jgi:hypothetical protein
MQSNKLNPNKFEKNSMKCDSVDGEFEFSVQLF